MIEAVYSLKKRYWEYLKRRENTHKNRIEWLSHAPARNAQANALRATFERPQEIKRVIIFLAPGLDIVNGGVMSIVSLYEETLSLKAIHGAECVLCSLPSDPPLLRYSKFQNNAELFDFQDVLNYFNKVQEVLVHVPEYAIQRYTKKLTHKIAKKLKKRNVCHNVMLQNIDMVNFQHYALLRDLGRITCTTAHQAYSGPEIEAIAQCQIYLLSVFISPEKYPRIAFSEKKDILVVSPDHHPIKEAVLERIHSELPTLDVRIVQDMPYSEYKNLISQAKWAITFGEGLDGYFIETVFSGGVSIAAYNERFFTEDFLSLETVFNDYDDLIENLVSTIKRLDTPTTFQSCQEEMFELCRSYYDHGRYVENLSAYYHSSFSTPKQ